MRQTSNNEIRQSKISLRLCSLHASYTDFGKLLTEWPEAIFSTGPPSLGGMNKNSLAHHPRNLQVEAQTIACFQVSQAAPHRHTHTHIYICFYSACLPDELTQGDSSGTVCLAAGGAGEGDLDTITWADTSGVIQGQQATRRVMQISQLEDQDYPASDACTIRKLKEVRRSAACCTSQRMQVTPPTRTPMSHSHLVLQDPN